MAEETLSARLALDISAFTSALQTAAQQVQTFATSVAQNIATASAAFAQANQAAQAFTQTAAQQAQAIQGNTQAVQGHIQATNQLAAAYIALAQSINNQTQAYAQAQAAALAFRQEQATAAAAARDHAAALHALGEAAAVAERGFLALAVALAAVAVKAVTAFAEFESSIAKVGTQIEGFSSGQLLALGAQVRELSVQFGQSAASIAKALFDVQSANFTTAESFKILRAAGALAVAGVTELDVASKATVSVLRAYNLSAEDATRVTQALFRAEQQARADMEELARGIGKILPAAASLRVDFRDLGALLAILNNQGITFNRAVTEVERALVSLAAPAKGAEKYLTAVGEATGQGRIEIKRFADGSVDLFRTLEQFKGLPLDLITKMIPRLEGARAVMALSQDLGALREALDKAHQSGSGLADGYSIMEKTVSQAFKEMREATNGFFTKLGEVISTTPGFVQAINAIKEIIVLLTQSMNDTNSTFGAFMALLRKIVEYESQVPRGMAQRMSGELQANEAVAQSYMRILELQKMMGTFAQRYNDTFANLVGGKSIQQLIDEEQKRYDILLQKANQLRQARELANKPITIPAPVDKPIVPPASGPSTWDADKQAIADITKLVQGLGVAIGGASAMASGIPKAYADMAAKYGAQFHVDPGLVSRVMKQESNYDPQAISPTGKHFGLMQVQGGTYGKSEQELYDAETNIATGTKLLAEEMKRYASYTDATRIALAAYNAGSTKVNQAIAQTRAQGNEPTFANISQYLPKETRAYVPSVMGVQGAISTAPDSGGLFAGWDTAKDRLKEMDKALDAIHEKLKAEPGLEAKLPPELRNSIDLMIKKRDILEQQIEDEKALPGEARKTVEALRQRQAEQERADKSMMESQDKLRKFIASAEDPFAKRRADITKEAKDLEEKFFGNEEAIAQIHQATTDKMKLVDEDQTKFINGELEKRRKAYQDVEDAISAVSAKGTKTRVDDVTAALAKERETLARVKEATEQQLQRFDVAATKEIERAKTDELQKELDKRKAAYEKFTDSIAKPLATVFESVFSSTKNGFQALLDSLKQMFVRFIANLAAEAITRQIIIPLILSVVGGASGGASGSGSGGTLGQLFQAVSGLAGLAGGSSSGSTGGDGGSGGAGVVGTVGSVAGLAGKSSLWSSVSEIPIASIFGSSGSSGAAAYTGAGFEAGFGTGQSGTALGGATVGSVAGAAGAGITVGFLASTLLSAAGLHGWGNTTLSGAAGGAVAGTMIMPGIGTAVGAVVGAIIGLAVGLIGGGSTPNPSFRATGSQGPGVTFNPQTGLQLNPMFNLTNANLKDLGTLGVQGAGKGDEFIKSIDDTMNAMFEGVIDSFRGLAPQIQEKVVGHLNADFKSAVDFFEQFTFKGPNTLKDLSSFLSQELPKLLNNELAPLRKAISGISPIVDAFNSIIRQAQENIVKLRQEALQQQVQLQTGIVSIQQALFGPAQQYVALQDSLQKALGLLGQATPQQQTTLIPQIQQLAQQIVQLASNQQVLGQDPQAVRNVQSEMVSLLQSLQGTSAGAYNSLTTTMQQQAELAQQQVDALVQSLDTVTSTGTGNVQDVIQASLAQLTAIQRVMESVSPTAQQDAQNQVQLALMTGQVASLQSIDQTEQAALQVLLSIANALIAAPQHAAGVGYVPFNQFAYLHQGERVVARHEAVGGGSGTFNINVHGVTDTDALVSTIIRRIEQRGGRLQNTSIVVR